MQPSTGRTTSALSSVRRATPWSVCLDCVSCIRPGCGTDAQCANPRLGPYLCVVPDQGNDEGHDVHGRRCPHEHVGRLHRLCQYFCRRARRRRHVHRTRAVLVQRLLRVLVSTPVDSFALICGGLPLAPTPAYLNDPWASTALKYNRKCSLNTAGGCSTRRLCAADLHARVTELYTSSSTTR